MPPKRFTVSQVRVAAACPRILYFDAVHTRTHKLSQPVVTRIWKAGAEGENPALGSLFHGAIEQFNQQAAEDPVVRQLAMEAPTAEELAGGLLRHVYQHHVDRQALFQRSGPQQQGFMAVLRRYVGELADILIHARNTGRAAGEVLEELFGDRRRRVDVTFPVGPAGEQVHVTGVLDYVFYDWRTTHHRIIDYKLTPAQSPSNDLAQVCLYALMHNVQHRTEPDAAVLYLHPERRMYEKPWERIHADRRAMFNLLASMAEWVDYDESADNGLKPPGEPLFCAACRWRNECEARLGPKHLGQRLGHWTNENLPNGNPRDSSTTSAKGEERITSSPSDQGGLRLGVDLVGQRMVTMPLGALPTHLAVVGAAGSGKTWLAKVIAEEAAYHGIPILAIDPQGDLVQFCRARPETAFGEGERPLRERFAQRVEPRIFTPGSSCATRLSLSPIRLPAAGDLIDDTEPERREEELNNVLATLAGNLTALARAGGDADLQRTFLFQLLRVLAQRSPPRNVGLEEVAKAVADPEAVGLVEPDRFLRNTEREKLARRLNSLLYGPASSLFTGGQPLDLNQLVSSTSPGRVPLNVIYLNDLPDDEQKQFFVAALAAEIYRWMITTGGAARGPQLLFYLDEAKDYLPAGNKKPAAKEPLIRLFAQGRKYGVACLVCTQSPRSVDFNVFSNCSTKAIGRLESAQDVARVAEWFGKERGAPPWLANRKGAEAGTFVARWPGQEPSSEGRVFKSRLLYTIHEPAWSPKRVEEEVRALRSEDPPATPGVG